MYELPAIVLAAVAHTAAAGTACDDLTGQPVFPNVDWQTEIKPLFNELVSPDGRCTSCHNSGQAAGGLDLSDVGFDAIYKLVNSYAIPGAPQASILFLKLNCDVPPFGSRMPIGGAPFTLDEQGLVHDWIAQGARGEPPDEPIFRDFLFRDGAESLRW